MLLHSCPVLELRAHAEGIVQGIAASFGGIDSFGDTIQPGAFSKTIADHSGAGTMPAMLWAHGASRVVGRWAQMGETARGLEVSGKLNLKTAGGRDAFSHLQEGDLGGLSIGFTMHPTGSTMREDGTRVIKSVSKLHEVSLVAMPSDEGARVLAVRSLDLAKPETARDFTAALQAIGYSRREAAQIATKGFAGFVPDAPDEEPDDDSELRAAHAAIAALTASFKPKG